MFALPLLRYLGLTDDFGVAVTGRGLWITSARPGVEPIRLDATTDVPPPKPPPARLPEAVRHGLTTRRHERTEPSREPIWVRGELVHFEAAERLLARGMRQIAGASLRRTISVKPRIVASIPDGATLASKRAMLDTLERAGGRRVYLVDYSMATAMGLWGERVVTDEVLGLLIIEPGYAQFAVVSYADMLTHASLPLGLEDMRLPPDPDAADGGLSRWREDVLNMLSESIQIALADLYDHQLEKLARQPIALVGSGAHAPGLSEAIGERLGLTIEPAPVDMPHAVNGLETYLAHLDQWSLTLEHRDS